MQSTPKDKKQEKPEEPFKSIFSDPDNLIYQPLYLDGQKAFVKHSERLKVFETLFKLIIDQNHIGEFYKKAIIKDVAIKLTLLLPLQNIEKNNEFITLKSYLEKNIDMTNWDLKENKEDSIKFKLSQLIETAHYQKYQYQETDTDLDAALGRFDREAEFKLGSPELKHMEGLFKKMTGYRNKYKLILASDTELDRLIKNASPALKNEFEKKEPNKNYLPVIVAAFREKIHRLYGIYPNKIQIINLFALLNNPRRIAQIKTGEGKSLMIAMLSAVFGLLGRKIDIITTSADLALPQAEKYKPFYQSFGLTVACNAGQECNCDPKVYQADIIYGTPEDFEAAKIQDGLGGIITEIEGEKKSETLIQTDGVLARGSRPYDIAIVDEADSMFLDTGNESLWVPLSNENPEIVPLYETIWEYVSTQSPPDLTELMIFINKKDIGVEFKEDDTRLDSVLHPLMLAAIRAKNSEEKKDYIIKEEKGKKTVEIVNLPTGQIQFGMRWGEGVHAFVELKHGIAPKCTVDINAASLSAPDLFSNYESLLGLTGTLGSVSDRKELEKVYQTSMYASPTASEKSNVFELEPLIVEDEQKQFETILENIQKEKGKPALIVMDTIDAVEKFKLFLAEKLSKYPEYKVNVYDRQKNLDELENILGEAGKPFAITITTNIGGRGTDIILTKESLSLGGLYEVTTYPPENQRIEDQASGRAGRQGQSGIIQTIVHKGQLKQFPEIKLEEKEGYKEFRVKREIYNQNKSQQRQKARLLLSLQYAAQEFYFSLPQAIKSELLKSWAVDCYNPIVTYIDNIKSFLEKNPNFYEVTDQIQFEEMVAKLMTDKIEAFWQKHLPSISKLMPAKENLVLTPELWVNQSKNKFADRLFSLARQMKIKTKAPESTSVLEEKKQVEVVFDLDLTLLPEFTGGTFDQFEADKAKPEVGIVHFEKLKQCIAAQENVTYSVASFGINVARSERVMKELKVDHAQTLGFHPDMMDVVLDELKVSERCKQNETLWGPHCVNNLKKILESAGFGKPPDLKLFNMCQLTLLTSCGEIGKNIHLLLSLLLRIESGKKPTDLVFVDDDPINIDAAKQLHLALPQLALLLKKPELASIRIHPILAEVKEVNKNKFTVNWFDKFDLKLKEVVKSTAPAASVSDSVSGLFSRESHPKQESHEPSSKNKFGKS